MAIQIASNFEISGNFPNYTRDFISSSSDNSYVWPIGYIAYCTGDGKHYKRALVEGVASWVEFSSGGGGGGTDTTYKLTLNGTTNGDSANGVNLGSLFAPTTGGTTANQLLISQGSGSPFTASSPIWTSFTLDSSHKGVLRFSGSAWTVTEILQSSSTSSEYPIIMKSAATENNDNMYYGIKASTNPNAGTITLWSRGYNSTAQVDDIKLVLKGNGSTPFVLSKYVSGTGWQAQSNQIITSDGIITAPTVADTFLKWDGSAFTWAAGTGSGGGGTVTSITAGDGIQLKNAAGTSNINEITSTGKVTLKAAATNEIGGIKVASTDVSNAGSIASSGTYYPIERTSSGQACVKVPTSGGGGSSNIGVGSYGIIPNDGITCTSMEYLCHIMSPIVKESLSNDTTVIADNFTISEGGISIDGHIPGGMVIMLYAAYLANMGLTHGRLVLETPGFGDYFAYIIFYNDISCYQGTCDTPQILNCNSVRLYSFNWDDYYIFSSGGLSISINDYVTGWAGKAGVYNETVSVYDINNNIVQIPTSTAGYINTTTVMSISSVPTLVPIADAALVQDSYGSQVTIQTTIDTIGSVQIQTVSGSIVRAFTVSSTSPMAVEVLDVNSNYVYVERAVVATVNSTYGGTVYVPIAVNNVLDTNYETVQATNLGAISIPHIGGGAANSIYHKYVLNLSNITVGDDFDDLSEVIDKLKISASDGYDTLAELSFLSDKEKRYFNKITATIEHRSVPNGGFTAFYGAPENVE